MILRKPILPTVSDELRMSLGEACNVKRRHTLTDNGKGSVRRGRGKQRPMRQMRRGGKGEQLESGSRASRRSSASAVDLRPGELARAVIAYVSERAFAKSSQLLLAVKRLECVLFEALVANTTGTGSMSIEL